MKQIHLARPAAHEQKDYALGLAGEVWRFGRHWPGSGSPALLGHQVRQGDAAQAVSSFLQESAARLDHTRLFGSHVDYSLVMNSSRFSSTLERLTQAAPST